MKRTRPAISRFRVALGVSLLAHAVLALILLWFPPSRPGPAPKEIYIQLEAPPPAPPEELREEKPSPPLTKKRARTSKPPSRTITPIPAVSPPPPVVKKKHPRRETEPAVPLPETAQSREILIDSAFTLLRQVLEKHPEYRHMLFRDLIAGSAVAPDTTAEILRLWELNILPYLPRYSERFSWLRELDRKSFLFGPTLHPVLGPRPEQKTGMMIDIPAFIKFLKGLLEE